MLYSPAPMHIPDGFLSLGISLFFWALTLVVVGLAISKTRQSLGEKQIPLMGVMAAFIFAAQMLNFTVAGGTSGHFLGGALAAMVLGPWAAILVMTAVVAVQGLLFQDGGLLVMGANIFNMGILTAAIGFGLYRLVASAPKNLRLGMAAVAAWVATMSAALSASLQLWLSGTSRLQIVIPAMLSVHALIGVGEAIITVAALAFIQQARPDLLRGEATTEKGGRGWMYVGLALALLAALLSPLASAYPDGLERVAADAGFLHRAQSMPFQVLPDYTLPLLGPTPLSTIVAGVVGVLVVFSLMILLARSLRGNR
ncbi:MAG: energy-coupling factor ABC transporter permease [Anaerolineae bacterium]